MRIIIGADHRGFEIKEHIVAHVQSMQHDVQDVGAHHLDPQDDYFVFAEAAVRGVLAKEVDLGILICGSGEGMAMEANRTPGIRAAVAWRTEVAQVARQHNDANILVLPADFISIEEAKQLVDVFIGTAFLGLERYQRRILAMDNPSQSQHG